MTSHRIENGGFTMPGEAGYEKLTLELAQRWGADMIRDSDGTELSPEITDAGYGIYSTICIIRDHNEWAKKNPDKLQQTILMSPPVTAEDTALTIDIMAAYYREQFHINDSARAMKYWQVFDRTAEAEVPRGDWEYDGKTGTVTVNSAKPWHRYTVNFLVYRIWEEISLYNHVTNHWGDREHLVPIEPFYAETREYLKAWLDTWCREHPKTTVVRFTSMFYNFVWIWGSSGKNRNLFTDWASYDYTVSDAALDAFEEKYGYRITAEDFINKGKRHATHCPADRAKRDWMAFINDFTIRFGRELIDIVHGYGKKALMFYDDSWVGTEPCGKRFGELGFDGVIKCGFSGFEVRLLASVKTGIRELRLHPYLFPTGVDGSPSFLPGGDPAGEARRYWAAMRRGMLRVPIDRIGLGGYLHLVQQKPEFVDCIEELADEFRMIQSLHRGGKPFTLRPRVAVLHAWGSLRPWTLSGHFHENKGQDLMHINESLSGLPLDVRFIDFEDVKNGALEGVDVVINCGAEGSAWSGGDAWRDVAVVERLSRFAFDGGVLIGVNEPGAVRGCDTLFCMAHVLGVDKDTGERVCHGKWPVEAVSELPEGLLPAGCGVQAGGALYLTDEHTRVLRAESGHIAIAMHAFGKGCGVYMAYYRYTPENTRMLLNLILYACGESLAQNYIASNPMTDCVYFPTEDAIVIANATPLAQTTTVETKSGRETFELAPYGICTVNADK
jgi:beta-D-galactosyl-(1->4)-L-rhamnose phosphorylase